MIWRSQRNQKKKRQRQRLLRSLNMMEESKLSVREQGKKIYDIYFRDSFDDLTEALSEAGLLNRKVCIVTESNVAPLYLKELYDLLNPVCTKVTTFSFRCRRSPQAVKDRGTFI